MKRVIAGLCMAALSLGAQTIEEQLKGLRGVPDSERGLATKNLAIRIRGLPKPDAKKAGWAGSLANLSTEGDFGRETLQAVADTLAQALREHPAAVEDGKYTTLAQLARYEHVTVALNAPGYTAAMAKLVAADKSRQDADLTLTDLQGNTWNLKSLRGKVVLVNFWATWCPPCRKEIPDLDALYQRFKDSGLVILGISDEDAAKVKPFAEEQKISYPVLLDPGRKAHTTFQVEGIPKSFIYDRAGKLAAQSIDMRTRKQFLELLAAAGLR